MMTECNRMLKYKIKDDLFKNEHPVSGLSVTICIRELGPI
jgi:hypothetical protein